MSGKGDSPRPVNLKVYRENFDAINWRKSFPAKMLASWEGVEVQIISHLAFMRSQGFHCATEEEAYELRGLLDM